MKEVKVLKENNEFSVSDADYINVRSSNYEKNILIPLEKIDGCDYVVKAKI